MRVAVMTPTYNERDNVDAFLVRVQAAVPTADIFFVDDNSPDDTATRVVEHAAVHSTVHLIRRTGERGYAAASREGLTTIADMGFDAIITIDCDLSHDPRVILTMLGHIEQGADVVIGSRYVAGGGVRNWSLSRRLLSRWGNAYTSLMLGIGVSDCTSGFRAYSGRVIRTGIMNSTTSTGYAFLSEVLFRLRRFGDCNVVEIPILYAERIAGESKMNKDIIFESMRRVTTWGFLRFWGRR